MTETTAPDDALLWARERCALDCAHEAELAARVLAGGFDNWRAVSLRAEAFRDGQAHAAALLEALAGPITWLDSWARHVGNCQGGYFCTCGLVAARSELSAAIAAVKGASDAK
jgi:hypothetical protein